MSPLRDQVDLHRRQRRALRELLRGVTILRSALFLCNLAIVFYVLYILQSGYRERHQSASAGLAESRRR